MNAFTTFTSPVVVVPAENIDTDQIIPARFLKTTEKAGLGKGLFSDWRYNADGSPKPDFPLNRADATGAQVLLAGDNFGCGSSREHAPWALMDFGFRAVISTSFADIFRNNSLKNGLLPVALQPEAHRRLMELTAAGPQATVTVDLENQRVILPDGTQASFPIDPFARTCLLQGVDELGYLLNHAGEIEAYEAAHGAGVNTLQSGPTGRA